jgi:hypothetical protein
MKSEERKFVRAVVRRVHPDLFAAHPQERLRNSESLKARLRILSPRRYSSRRMLRRSHCWLAATGPCTHPQRALSVCCQPVAPHVRPPGLHQTPVGHMNLQVLQPSTLVHAYTQSKGA